MICKYCSSENVVKNGRVGSKQRYICRVCGHQFTEGSDFPKMRVESEVVTTALDLYFEGLSVRKVQRQIAKIFGVKVSQVSIWKWIMKYSQITYEFMEWLTPKLSGEWHVDDTAIKCRGVQKWFWEIIDDKTKFLVSSHLSESRTTKDVVALFERAMAVAKSRPKTIYVDGLPAYEDGFKKVFYSRYKHRKVQFVRKVGIRSRITNNIVERLHGTLKDRTKVTRGLKQFDTVDVLLKGWNVYYNFVRPHQSLHGKTPAEASGIEMEKNWRKLIKEAIKNEVQNQLAYESFEGERETVASEEIPVLVRA